MFSTYLAEIPPKEMEVKCDKKLRAKNHTSSVKSVVSTAECRPMIKYIVGTPMKSPLAL
jgi:hypothetical protein